jgi:hypothetical protein
MTSSPRTSPEAWQLYVANATYRRGARRGRNRHTGVDRFEAEDVVLAVTGGTGNYRYARGEATFGFQGDGRVGTTYELGT